MCVVMESCCEVWLSRGIVDRSFFCQKHHKQYTTITTLTLKKNHATFNLVSGAV